MTLKMEHCQPMEIESHQKNSNSINTDNLDYSASGNILHYGHNSSFRLIHNHKFKSSIKILLQFLHILKKGLPEMNPNILYKSIFNTKNECLLFIFQHKLIGGVCFSCEPQRYAKIEYMAIEQQSRSKGKGQLLMNALKRLLQIRRITLVVTNAADNSKGYYLKQGFCQTEYIDNSQWSPGYQNFLNSVKMQCLVSPDINYFKLKRVLKQQKIILMDSLKPFYVDSTPYHLQGETYTCTHINQYTRQEQFFGANPSKLPGLEHQWQWIEYSQLCRTKEREMFSKFFFLKNICTFVQPQLQSLQTSNYQLIVLRQPIDLSWIFAKIERQEYECESQLFEDLESLISKARHLHAKNDRVLRNIDRLAREIAKINIKQE